MKTIAIVGASTDRSKFGNKAVRAFVRAGWRVYPVNPKADEVEGLKSYNSLGEVPEKVDWVSVYLPPSVTQGILPELIAAEPGEVYFNPGSATGAIVEAVREQGLEAHAACSIVAIGMSPDSFSDE